MSFDHYILDADGQPQQADWDTYLEWYRTSPERHVGNDRIQTPQGEIHISTVFLTMDHGFGEGPPVLWETMIFGGANSQYQERYCTREEALAGHKRALEIAVGPAIE